MISNDLRDRARRLFVFERLPAPMVAAQLRLTPSTVWRWSHEEGWGALRRAAQEQARPVRRETWTGYQPPPEPPLWLDAGWMR